MRGPILFATFLFFVGHIIPYPFVGILVWNWISLMSPHISMGGGPFSDLPYALIVSVLTVLAWLFSNEKKAAPQEPLIWLLIAFMVWMTISTFSATNVSLSYPKWDITEKIFFMLVITRMMLTTPARVHAMLWVMVLSLGFYGVKGGGFALLTGGSFRVAGAPGTFIGDNNHAALAFVMLLPIMEYLRRQTINPAVRLIVLASMLLTLLSVAFSYSRGAVVAMAVMLTVFLIRTKQRFVMMIFVGAALTGVYFFAPAQWFQRVDTIQSYDQDASASGRLLMWQIATQIAMEYPTGGGFLATQNRRIAGKYLPAGETLRAAHSIYFEVLGEHGFVGLGLFLSMIFISWRNGEWIRRATKGRPDLAWAGEMANMLQISAVGFLSGGAFLSLAYFDGFWNTVIVLAAVRQIVANRIAEPALSPRPADMSVTGGLQRPAQ